MTPASRASRHGTMGIGYVATRRRAYIAQRCSAMEQVERCRRVEGEMFFPTRMAPSVGERGGAFGVE